MQFKDTLRKLVLLSITAFAVFSCITVDKSLGEEYIPEDQDLAIKVAEFRLPVVLKMEDSLQGISTDYCITGAIRTPQFGLVTFGTAANVCQPHTKFRFGEAPVIKSIFFSAAVVGSSVTEDNQKNIPQDIFIYRTNKVIDTTTLYCNSITSEDYNPVPLNLSSVTYFGGDSIKVYLKNEYGTELLSATEAELDSVTTFIKRFKGLYVGCSAPEQGLTGGRMNHIDYQSAAIVMKYNFQPTWEAGLARKDTTIYLSFGDAFCLNTSSYSSEELATDQQLAELPIEGVAGIKPYVDAQALKQLLDRWAEENKYDSKKIIVSKATYTMPFEIPQNMDMSKYPTFLYPIHRKDTTTKYYYPFDDINSTGNNHGLINRSLREYSGEISSTIQKMINKPSTEIDSKYDFWFSPLRSYTDPNYGSVSYILDNYNYYVGKVNGPAAERYPKLKIVYSELDMGQN